MATTGDPLCACGCGSYLGQCVRGLWEQAYQFRYNLRPIPVLGATPAIGDPLIREFTNRLLPSDAHVALRAAVYDLLTTVPQSYLAEHMPTIREHTVLHLDAPQQTEPLVSPTIWERILDADENATGVDPEALGEEGIVMQLGKPGHEPRNGCSPDKEPLACPSCSRDTSDPLCACGTETRSSPGR